VALTKTDLAEPELVELVKLETEEFLHGSFLEGAPVVPVSATTGAGLDELRKALTGLANYIQPRDVTLDFRMPVDRSFVMQGFGAVATGTVVTGVASVEDELEVHPEGRLVRVRGIQVHGSASKKATAGQRAAINLAAIDASELSRGDVLAKPGCFQTTTAADCIFELLPSARPLKNRAPVHLQAGTAETIAEVRTQDGSGMLRPGTSAVRIVLRDPMLLVPGDRFIVRQFSPLVTIAGGRVVDIRPPGKATAQRTTLLAKASLPERIAIFVRESAFGLALADVALRTGATAAEIANNVPASVLFLREPKAFLIVRGL
jgi:selenocysteine-specific elongation factor